MTVFTEVHDSYSAHVLTPLSYLYCKPLAQLFFFSFSVVVQNPSQLGSQPWWALCTNTINVVKIIGRSYSVKHTRCQLPCWGLTDNRLAKKQKANLRQIVPSLLSAIPYALWQTQQARMHDVGICRREGHQNGCMLPAGSLWKCKVARGVEGR